jgi:hypothetical protein
MELAPAFEPPHALRLTKLDIAKMFQCAYCSMRNHYHVVLETPNANLLAGMAWLQSTCTIRPNHRHRLFGHVFSGRYKAQLVEGSLKSSKAGCRRWWKAGLANTIRAS